MIMQMPHFESGKRASEVAIGSIAVIAAVAISNYFGYQNGRAATPDAFGEGIAVSTKVACGETVVNNVVMQGNVRQYELLTTVVPSGAEKPELIGSIDSNSSISLPLDHVPDIGKDNIVRFTQPDIAPQIPWSNIKLGSASVSVVFTTNAGNKVICVPVVLEEKPKSPETTPPKK